MNILNNKKNLVLFILSGFFITNALVAEMIGSKLIHYGPFVNSVGLIIWPFVFLLTDTLNEFYGKTVVKRLTYITVGLIIYVFLILFVAIRIKAVDFSPTKDEAFRNVFGQSMYMIVASVVAFIASQLLDSFSFWFIRKKTGNKMIWLRATGSTVISQLVDTFIVQSIAFVLPGVWTWEELAKNGSFAYLLKLIIALLLIPLIYLLHKILKNYFGNTSSKEMIEKTAEESLDH